MSKAIKILHYLLPIAGMMIAIIIESVPAAIVFGTYYLADVITTKELKSSTTLNLKAETIVIEREIKTEEADGWNQK